MQLVHTITETRNQSRKWKADGHTVALVATMGNLHAGHLQLIDAAREQADRVIVSVFVNPTQFGEGEDFEQYPRTLEEDCEKVRMHQADQVFAPAVNEIYPVDGAEIIVQVPSLNRILCGAFRPGHFDGVATVVSKLFHITEPDLAVFGKKDYQQLRVIEQMVAGLNMPVKIIGVDTMREPDGLAMSSRNQYLTEQERKAAPELFASLKSCADAIQGGERDYSELQRQAADRLVNAGFDRPDYVEIRNAADLSIASDSESQLVILAAARLGKARLIDNLEVCTK